MANKKKFINFLKTNDALEKFERNFELDRKEKNIKEYIKRVRSPLLIRAAFGWELTLEGGGYWKELDDKWKSYN